METSISDAAFDGLIPETCWVLLGQKHLGRLAVVIDAEIHVMPVNYALHAKRIVVRTSSNALLAEAAPCNVTLEVDDIDEVARRGWSVSVKGLFHEITDADEASQIASLDIDTWAPGSKPLVFEITPGELTGRHLYPTPTTVSGT